MSKSYTNPAFTALGIKQFKLPSRNWLIFWSVLTTLSGGIIYDKWKQRQLRDDYMKKFNTNNKPFDTLLLPRKLRIYVSPPPNDYLDESLKYFRRFVKPIINSAGLDFELITLEKQGDVRFKVAEEIRELRRNILNNEKIQVNENSTFEKQNSIDNQSIKKVSELYKPMDVLGVEKLFGNFQDHVDHVKSEDSLVSDVRNAGGIICIGRGAFKEYINGVHEGLLGPIDPPPKIESITEEKEGEEEGEEKLNKYAPDPYILSKDYDKLIPAKEFGLDTLNWENESEVNEKLQSLRDPQTGLPYFFTQPILELRNYNVAGFTKQLERIWRFYNKRYQLIEYNERLIDVIKNNWCSFTIDKLNVGIEEENDWPSSWLETAKKNNSEWVRDFNGDKRIIKLLSSYNCDCNNDKGKGKN